MFLKMAKVCVVVLAITAAMALKPLAHESPIDHVDRDIRIWISEGSIFLRYQMQLSERAAMMQLQHMDTDGNGSISNVERDGYFAQFSGALCKQLHLFLDEKELALKPDKNVRLSPQCRQAFTFNVPIGELSPGKHLGRLVDDYSRNYPGNYRWDPLKPHFNKNHNVTVREAPAESKNGGHAGALIIHYEIVVP
jgi:hypothetical protein